ncbi:hypothetical protein [Pseudomonas saponiphila]|uniref:hypothetical protein n=1 Tax=Pseudomonas saponiphila TaxID=556534 RepID=UPI00223EF21C|nr:hypothetical protein [Pseudomonas saponiphila]
METSQTNDVDRGEPQPSHVLNGQVAQYDVPLCPNRLILAVEAVRGSGVALVLLREHLHLRTTAKLVFSTYSGCFFLQLDEIDRFQNQRVGMLEAVSAMPFKSSEIFKHEVSTWTVSDIAAVKDAVGIRALTELGLISPTP